jgi:hypothetical protein
MHPFHPRNQQFIGNQTPKAMLTYFRKVRRAVRESGSVKSYCLHLIGAGVFFIMCSVNTPLTEAEEAAVRTDPQMEIAHTDQTV